MEGQPPPCPAGTEPEGTDPDGTPEQPDAGKLRPAYGTVASCLTEVLPRPVTPTTVRKFRNTTDPAPGAKVIFYGTADDPDIATHLTHGIKSRSSFSVASLISPIPKTVFQEKVQDMKETIYYSSREERLGRTHDQSSMLPEGLDIINTTFGKKTIKDIPAGLLVNPPKTFEEVDKEAREGHDLYVVSHEAYDVGEAVNRKYNSHFNKSFVYGMETPRFEDGRNTAKTLKWAFDLESKRAANLVLKRSDDFKEKFQPQLGKALDPMAETMNVPPGHTFGLVVPPDEYGLYDLLHDRVPCEFLRGKKLGACLVPEDTQRKDEPQPKQEALMLKEPESSEKTPKTPTNPTDRVFASYQTTSSQYNAVVGGLPLSCYPMCGIPTIRSDIPAPRIRRLSDTTNYGDQGTSFALLFPSVFGQNGVHERELLKKRPKAEIAQIVHNIGMDVSGERLEEIWKQVCTKHEIRELCDCEESMWNILHIIT
ncbi:EF-hand domain-containing family member B isoform X2 [Pipra filicauda]|uniref:EF-hand domain-containing family member B isoform X2 n=1 Tax=Pipra filicauda TaxID=649802 RepID=A0A7R5L6U3_9PASS|nr:EF-hand domain-containing family member B isoform X2 [Pipra filicauda]